MMKHIKIIGSRPGSKKLGHAGQLEFIYILEEDKN